MPIPQVTDRIKEAPAVVLRALFAGIGQLLLAADKLRTRTDEPAGQPASPPPRGTQAQQARPSEPPATHPAPQAAATPPPAPARKAAAPSPNKPTSKSQKRAPRAPKASTQAAKPAVPTAKPATKAEKPATPTAKRRPSQPRKPAAPTQKPATATAKKAADTPPKESPSAPATKAAPPIPGYDDLSVASLRARLRVLDPPTVRALLAYEKSHAGRDVVITMFERRLSKLGTGAG